MDNIRIRSTSSGGERNLLSRERKLAENENNVPSKRATHQHNDLLPPHKIHYPSPSQFLFPFPQKTQTLRIGIDVPEICLCAYEKHFMNSCNFGNPSNIHVAVSGNILRGTCPQFSCHCTKEWLFSSETMELNTGNSHSNEKQPLESSTSASEQRNLTEKNKNTSLFVNHAALDWHENRRKWVGDLTQKQQNGTVKEPIISWSTTYEDLLSTHEPFSEPIPLPEMVDFLVDIWHDEGLYD